ncbi:MAG: hypothetical protein KKH44_08400 [Bacteroidetes bacterium]|nr:hypothetical protein [Bacteroidota bacterium]
MIVKTARKLEIGDELLPWANNDEEYEEFESRIETAKNEIKALPPGAKFITFMMRKDYRQSRPQNTRMLYKRSVVSFQPKTGAPVYKDHMLQFIWGMIKTSNYEEIAFLDMHNKWFMREADRELTPAEKLAKENAELKAKLAALQDIDKQKEEIIKETEKIEQQHEELLKEEPVKVVEQVKEIKQRGRPKKSKTR